MILTIVKAIVTIWLGALGFMVFQFLASHRRPKRKSAKPVEKKLVRPVDENALVKNWLRQLRHEKRQHIDRLA